MKIKTTVEFNPQPDAPGTAFTVGRRVNTDELDTAFKRAVDWLSHNNVKSVKIEVTK